jgi:phosphoserine phosphatase RsbU/P
MQCMEVWGGNRSADSGVVMPGLDVWVFAEPFAEPSPDGSASVVTDRGGGDVHLVSSCGTGRITRMMVADIAGHGERVAEVGATLRRLMRRFMNYLDQTAFVEALNRAFGELDADGRFATSVAMTFFAPTARLDICNAGHPRPMRFSRRAREWRLLDTPADAREERAARGRSEPLGEQSDEDVTNLPLGILEPTRYEQFGIELDRDDLVIVYTDALIEARAPDGTMLGEEGLRRMLASLDAERPERLIPDIIAAVAAWRGGAPSDDDITVLLLRHNGSAVQAPLLRRLAASLRFFGTLLRSLVPFGERPPIPWPELRSENIIGAVLPGVARRWRATR